MVETCSQLSPARERRVILTIKRVKFIKDTVQFRIFFRTFNAVLNGLSKATLDDGFKIKNFFLFPFLHLRRVCLGQVRAIVARFALAQRHLLRQC